MACSCVSSLRFHLVVNVQRPIYTSLSVNAFITDQLGLKSIFGATCFVY